MHASMKFAPPRSGVFDVMGKDIGTWPDQRHVTVEGAKQPD